MTRSQLCLTKSFDSFLNKIQMASSRNSFSPLSFAEFLNQQELNNIQHDMLNIRQFAGPAMSSERTAYQPKRSYSDQVKNGQTRETYIPKGLVDKWFVH